MRITYHTPTLSLLRVFSGFDCDCDGDGDDMVIADELCLTLHQLGFEVAADEMETKVKSHIRPGNLGLIFNNFVALQELLGVKG
ncbi:hypothetical protein ACLOJK_025727 [Asimina triloba]